MSRSLHLNGAKVALSMPLTDPGQTVSHNVPIESPFPRLRVLLGDLQPGADPIDMSIGEPGHPMPDFLTSALVEAAPQFAKYPPIDGSEDHRAALVEWLSWRYGLADQLDADKHVLTLSGSREGLFSAIFPAIARKTFQDRPAALIPNPFYQVYAGAAVAAGAEPIYLAADGASGFLPDLDVLGRDLELMRRTAAFYLCSPSNPQGVIADRDYLSRAIGLARKHNFMFFADECYSEVYTRESPPGSLQVASADGQGFANVIAFNSLSKRSNLPGLRSGFCAGDEDFLAALTQFRNVTAPQVPLPIQHAAATIWRNEAHVELSRDIYRQKFDIADRLLTGHFGYRRPGGGFFLWLKIEHLGDGEAIAVRLWKRCGVKVLPGAFLTRSSGSEPNSGSGYIRAAMVHDVATTETALARIVSELT